MICFTTSKLEEKYYINVSKFLRAYTYHVFANPKIVKTNYVNMKL